MESLTTARLRQGCAFTFLTPVEEALLVQRIRRPLSNWQGQVWTPNGWITLVQGTQDHVWGWAHMTQSSTLTLWTEHVPMGTAIKAVFRIMPGSPRIRILDPYGYDASF